MFSLSLEKLPKPLGILVAVIRYPCPIIALIVIVIPGGLASACKRLDKISATTALPLITCVVREISLSVSLAQRR